MLMHKYGYSIDFIENQYPWEREVFIHMLTEHLKEESDKNKNR